MTRATTKALYIMQPRELAAWFTDNWIWIWFTGLWPRCTRREGRWSWCIRVFGVDRNNAVTCFCLVHCCRITICFRHRADKLLQTAANFSFSRWIIETTLEQSGRNTCLEISLFFFSFSPSDTLLLKTVRISTIVFTNAVQTFDKSFST